MPTSLGPSIAQPRQTYGKAVMMIAVIALLAGLGVLTKGDPGRRQNAYAPTSEFDPQIQIGAVSATVISWQ